MGRRQHHPTPAVGVADKWKRHGHEVVNNQGKVLFQGKSLRQAKQFFRTGVPGNNPAKVKSTSREGVYIPKGRH